jgi:hypothetical protein
LDHFGRGLKGPIVGPTGGENQRFHTGFEAMIENHENYRVLEGNPLNEDSTESIKYNAYE